VVKVGTGVVVVNVDEKIEIPAGGEILGISVKEISCAGTLKGTDIVNLEPLMLI